MRDTLRAYTVDSVLVNVTLVARDTLVDGLKVYLYRLPSTVDSTVTFADVDSQLVEANLIDSIAVPDTLNSGASTRRCAARTWTGCSCRRVATASWPSASG